jgi:hypothetical protein
MSLYSLGLNESEMSLLSHCCAEQAKKALLEIAGDNDLESDEVNAFFEEKEIELNGKTITIKRAKNKNDIKYAFNKLISSDLNNQETVSLIIELMKMGRINLNFTESEDRALPMPMGLIGIAHGSTGAHSLVDETGHVGRFSSIHFHTARTFRYDLMSSKQTDYSKIMAEACLLKVHLSPKQFARVVRANGAPTPITLSRYLGEIFPEPDNSLEFSDQIIKKDGAGLNSDLEKALEDAINDVYNFLTPVKAITSKKASSTLTELLVVVGDAYMALATAMQEQRKEDMKTLLEGYMQKFQTRVKTSIDKLPLEVKGKVSMPTFSLKLDDKR